MSEAYELKEALGQVNPADPERFAQASILPLFAHLRAVDPVHYCEDSGYGPFWSITRYEDIQNIDKDHERFSSDVFNNPNDLDIQHANVRQHLSFGFGLHRCLGMRLAELQLKILWEEILKRWSRIEVIGEPARVSSNFVKGYSEMLVKIHA